MTLPAPRLDDRTFQDIVDECKRRIHRLCPEWTDHNVSDPGVALIELFAWMTEMMLYRLNQVPDRLYVKFLELVGVELFGTASAQTDLLFRLTGEQHTARVPAGTQVSTQPVGDEEPIIFMTDEDLQIVPAVLVGCLTISGTNDEDHWHDLGDPDKSVVCFRALTPGDAFYLGFRDSLASNLIRLHMVTTKEGAGGSPAEPPLRWEIWSGEGWEPATVLSDTTQALNSPEGGDIEMLLPPRHEPGPVALARAYWLRCVLVKVAPEPGGYDRSPELKSLRAVSIGGAVSAQHALAAPAELLGTSSGEPAQSFQVRRYPVLPRKPYETVRVVMPRVDGRVEEDADQLWKEVEHFGLVDPDATDRDKRVFVWESSTGQVRFGPSTVGEDGRGRQYGAVPPVDAQIFVTGYRHGGGRRGNVGAEKLTVMRTSIPSVDGVTNLQPAKGGVDAETIENAKVRGPLWLRSGDRAVTGEDFERLTLDAAAVVGRARCLPPVNGGPIRVLVVPRVDVAAAELQRHDLILGGELVTTITRYLDERRLLTAQVQIAEPSYQGVKVVAMVQGIAGVRRESIRENALMTLYRYLNPLSGGADGNGWPFGRSLNDGDIHALLRGVPGVATVEHVHFLLADLDTGEVQDEQRPRISLSAGALLMSHKHQVEVES